MARFRVGLDAEERAGTVYWQLSHNYAEVDAIEDLARVSLAIHGCELDPGAFPPRPDDLRVLELAQLGRRRQLSMVAILDLHAGKRTMKSHRVGMRTPLPSHLGAGDVHRHGASSVSCRSGPTTRRTWCRFTSATNASAPTRTPASSAANEESLRGDSTKTVTKHTATKSSALVAATR